MSQPTPTRRGRRLPVATAVVIVVLILVVAVLVWQAAAHPLASGPSSSPIGTTSASASSPATRPSGTASARAGCPSTPGTSTPSGADVHVVVDVDGDGRPDQAWLTAGADRRFGITTASGATFSARIDSASPLPAAAIVGIVQDRQPVALVDLGRETLLYSLSGCQVTVPQNPTGGAFTFDRGFADEGTGVGCQTDAGEVRLAGLEAVQDAGASTYTVTLTWVDLSADGRSARLGTSVRLAEGATAQDPTVVTAREVTCGDALAGRDGPVEPS